MTYADIKVLEGNNKDLNLCLINSIVCTDLKLILADFCLPTNETVIYEFLAQDPGAEEKTLLAKIEIPPFNIRNKVEIVRNDPREAIVDKYLNPSEAMLNLSEEIKKTGVLSKPDKSLFTLKFNSTENPANTVIALSGCGPCPIRPWCWY